MFLATSACFAQMKAEDFDDLEIAIVDSQGDESRLENEIIPRLDKAIEAHPDDPRLIKHRLETFVQLGLLGNAKKDADRMIALTNSTSFRFLSCTLAESMGNGTKEDYLQCYRDVYLMYSTKVKDIDFLHVLSASMGELPDAEKIRTDYLKSIQNEELRNWYVKDLVPFNRDSFLLRAKNEVN